jgi:hypothetical protein
MNGQDRVDATAAALLNSAQSAEMFITGDGRIGEGDLALLLGWNAGSLRNARIEGRGPPAFNLGGSGHRVTYRLTDVAAWIEAQRFA